MKPLSVIIPSKNASNLVPCIAAIRKHEPGASLIVVDDGLQWTPENMGDSSGWGDIRIIPGRKPFVFSTNCNIGIRAAGEMDVCLVNDDTILESPNGFSLMQKAAEEHPEIGIIGATTNLTGQPLQRPRGVGLRIVPHIAFVCVLIPYRTHEYLSYCVNQTLTKDGHIVERSQPFTGGFLDERYRVDYGCEDADYCEQVTRAGLKVAVHDQCYVDHGSLMSSFRGDPKAPASFAGNYKLLMDKWGRLESQS